MSEPQATEERDRQILTLWPLLEAELLNLSGWVKLLGVAHMIVGVLQALSVVGLVVAWLPIWLGVLLFQAGNRAAQVATAHRPQDLLETMRKLRLFFVIQGIVLLVMLGIFVLVVLMAGGALFQLVRHLPETYY